MILTSALLCMALNLYHESRGENVAGEYAVALVTMNRAHGDTKQVCPTVLKRKQFSWTNALVKNKTLVAAGKPRDQIAWRRAVIIAKIALSGKLYDFTNGSTFYHAKSVRPAWRKSMMLTRVIGQHVFYRLS